jgi:hypothetical protein
MSCAQRRESRKRADDKLEDIIRPISLCQTIQSGSVNHFDVDVRRSCSSLSTSNLGIHFENPFSDVSRGLRLLDQYQAVSSLSSREKKLTRLQTLKVRRQRRN